MYAKKECIAMLLAGGQGSRLYVLTRHMAKPAVPFGGRYRIIDFPLSNCSNSGLDTVGVLTQYEPMALNAYIGTGQPWDLDRSDGGVHILPPYTRSRSESWYKGTANAICQNIPFVEQFGAEYVLILSGDHIYKMDYSLMLEQHKASGAACTIAVIDVPKDEAHRFGILSADENRRITAFEEKPREPKSTLASMGIYIFTWKTLKDYLLADDANPRSENDFGKNIIPAMLGDGRPMYVYPFSGYWKDVGTIQSLWEANMDLLAPDNPLNLNDPAWRIYSRTPASPPQYLATGAEVQHSLINEGCTIAGKVEQSVLFSDVTVDKGAEVRYSILMPGVHVKKGARIQFSIVAEDAEIGEDAAVGPAEIDSFGTRISVVAAGVHVGTGAKVPAGAMPDTDVTAEKEDAVHA